MVHIIYRNGSYVVTFLLIPFIGVFRNSSQIDSNFENPHSLVQHVNILKNKIRKMEEDISMLYSILSTKENVNINATVGADLEPEPAPATNLEELMTLVNHQRIVSQNNE